jgi:hypothetical protein
LFLVPDGALVLHFLGGIAHGEKETCFVVLSFHLRTGCPEAGMEALEPSFTRRDLFQLEFLDRFFQVLVDILAEQINVSFAEFFGGSLVGTQNDSVLVHQEQQIGDSVKDSLPFPFGTQDGCFD